MVTKWWKEDGNLGKLALTSMIFPLLEEPGKDHGPEEMQ